MPSARSTKLQQICVLLAGLLILKVTASVVLGYRNYFPPNFNADFLRGRENYFFDSYQWAFYAHIATGPVTLLLGMLLVSEKFRRRFIKWHRRLGRIQVATILLAVAPSGLWMAYFAMAGTIAAIGFALLAVLTALCAALGWKAAMQRRFPVHRRWMLRCFVLLCAAVVIRLMGGFAVTIGFHAAWFDSVSGWACWIVPLAALELWGLWSRRAVPTPPASLATARTQR